MEINLKIKAQNDRWMERRSNLYELARLVVIGFKNPDNFPDRDEFVGIQEEEVVEDTPEEHRERCLQRGTKPPPR